MYDSASQWATIQQMLPRAANGDDAALDALLRHCGERLTILTRRMLGRYARVRRWAETDDVLQNALVRLVGALRSVKPQTSREFLALATLQIRRELIDLARHYYGPEGVGANHHSRGPQQGTPADQEGPPDVRDEPSSIAQWAELHEQIDLLPVEEREVLDLLFYQEFSQAEAAEALNVSVRTIQRRWHDALGKLHQIWHRS
ncbi:MAG: RNA polymerase sigma factor [Planctomycetes bacterium]|nr:RNA polymerase sigma factor [Planctomycetota bacterium]